VVEKLQPMDSFNAQPPPFLDDIQAMKRLLVVSYAWLQATSFQEHELKAFCRVIPANSFYEKYSPFQQLIGGYPSASESKEVVKKWLSYDEDYLGKSSNAWMLLRWVTFYGRGRSIFPTKERAFGLGANDTRPGDIVTILLGCQILMVLRPRSESGYEVIGEAYCDGFMYGDALLGPLPQPFVLRERYGAGNWYFNSLNQETGLF
jgi:hypothetical protein